MVINLLNYLILPMRSSLSLSFAALLLLSNTSVVYGATFSVSQISYESAPNEVIVTPLQHGYYGEEVSKLQQLLAENPAVYPEGYITGFYGDLTELAVTRYQDLYHISPLGLLTDMTRDKLNESDKVIVLKPADESALTELQVISKTSEIDLINACMFKSATTSPCEKTDLNKDGFTNMGDVALLKSLIKFDLNGDNKIDVNSVGSADVLALAACVFKAAAGTCAAADLTADGIVNFADLSALRNNIKYDLNGDLVIDLRSSVNSL
ncbi:MAG: hypothetical protein RLZZ230_379 [Candidatus Parcubacteria bacterium]|jgi:peptidoglycan hydrolase-like protein with peptidoglycan-binding domain